MEPPGPRQSMSEMPHSCDNPSFTAAVVALACLMGLLALVCVAQTAYVLRLRPLLARYIRDDSRYCRDGMYSCGPRYYSDDICSRGPRCCADDMYSRGPRYRADDLHSRGPRHYSDETYSRGRSRHRRGEGYPRQESGRRSPWLLGYNSEPYEGPWDSPARSPSREDSRYERMRRHRDVERAERRRLRSERPPSFVRTPSTYYASPRSSSMGQPRSPRQGQPDRAEARGPALPRPRRVVSFPNLGELRAWGAACEAQGYVYDGRARGYAQPVCPEGYTPADPRYPAFQLWGYDLVEMERRQKGDHAYVRKAYQAMRD